MGGRDTPLCAAESPIFPTFIALQIVVKMPQRCEKIVQIGVGSMHKYTLRTEDITSQ